MTFIRFLNKCLANSSQPFKFTIIELNLSSFPFSTVVRFYLQVLYNVSIEPWR